MAIQLFGVSTLGIRVITFRPFEEKCHDNKETNILATQPNNPAEIIEFSSQMKCLILCVCLYVMEINNGR